MCDIKELAEKLLRNSSLEVDVYDRGLVLELMIEFGKQVCDLQIKECDIVVDMIYYDRIGDISYKSASDRVLGTKNVCGI